MSGVLIGNHEIGPSLTVGVLILRDEASIVRSSEKIGKGLKNIT
jgi:hypothetical protein